MTGIVRIFVELSVAAATFMLAFFCLFPVTSHAAERQMLWQSREQFVALEPREDKATGPAERNSHPSDLTINQITALLAAVQFTAGKNASAEPLFTVQALDTLAPQLVLALQRATPEEDLTFAIISLHKALMGLAKEPRVTTGRLFIRDGRLNLIVGLAQRDVNEREDRRLAPFSPGSRQITADGEWSLQTPSQPPGYTLVRRDWITVATDWRTSTPVDSSPKIKPLRSPAERLSTLIDLKSKGLITDEEYHSKRQQILNEL